MCFLQFLALLVVCSLVRILAKSNKSLNRTLTPLRCIRAGYLVVKQEDKNIMGITYIFGAGTEYCQGVPIVSNLAVELMKFEEDNKDLCAAMRSGLKGMRFRLKSSVLQDASNYFRSLFSDSNKPDILIGQLEDDNIKPSKEEEGSLYHKYWRFLYKIAQKIKCASDGLYLDEDLKDVIEEIADIGVIDYKLIQDSHIVPSFSIERSLSKIFETMMLTDSHEEVGSHKIGNLKNIVLGGKWNIEKLLADHFQGFYQENNNKKKIYAYLSWLLWFYFRVKQAEVKNNHNKFYEVIRSILEKDDYVFTFNYTKLAELAGIKDIVHVHGDLDKYYNYATRVGANLPDPKDTPNKEIENLKELITKILSFDNNLINLPSLVPPLPFKPMLTLESVHNYYKFYEHMQTNKTNMCLVIGYSYSDVDSHLNMMFRQYRGKMIHINPDQSIPNVIAKLKGVSIDSIMSTFIAGIQATQIGSNDIWLPLKAEEVTDKVINEAIKIA